MRVKMIAGSILVTVTNMIVRMFVAMVVFVMSTVRFISHLESRLVPLAGSNLHRAPNVNDETFPSPGRPV